MATDNKANLKKDTNDNLTMMTLQVSLIINNLVNSLRPILIVNANVQYTEEYRKQVDELHMEGTINDEMKVLLLTLVKPNPE